MELPREQLVDLEMAKITGAEPTPRFVLFFYSVPLLLLASALSGIGFVLSSALLLISGTIVWIVWFLVLFLIALPQTDDRLRFSRRMDS